MKFNIFVIFSIISFNLISSKYSNFSDIIKGSINGKNFNPNKTKPINSTNESSLEDQKDLEESYYSNNSNFKIGIPINKSSRPSIIAKQNKRARYMFKFGARPTGQHITRRKYTGIQGISSHEVLGFKKGSLFMSICVMAGLTSDKQIKKAHEWALENKYITNDNKLNISNNELIDKISANIQTKYHKDWKIVEFETGHFHVVNSEGKEIFNSYGFGFKGYPNRRKQ